MHDHTHALTNQMIIVPSTNLRRRHATQREGAVSPCIDGWMDGCLLHSHVRSRSGSRRPDDGRKQLLCLATACVRGDGTARWVFFFCRVAFVAFDRTRICAPIEAGVPSQSVSSFPYPIELRCVALRTRSMHCHLPRRTIGLPNTLSVTKYLMPLTFF